MNMKKGKTELKIENSSKIQMHTNEEEAKFIQTVNRNRFQLDSRSRTLILIAICLTITLMLVILLPNSVDSNNHYVSVAWSGKIIANNIGLLFAWLGGGDGQSMPFVVFRFLIVALVGAALAISGAIYQGCFKNALASPTTLGVESGGVLGGTIYVMFFYHSGKTIIRSSELQALHENMNIFQKYAQSFWILLGCFLGVFLIVTISKWVGKGKISSIALILCGSVFGSVISSIMGLVQYYMLMKNTYSDKTTILRYMMMGTFSRTFTLEHLLMIGIPILVGIIIVMSLRTRLNLLVFGEDEAKTMGINVVRTRYVMVAVATILTAVVISFCGMIGFLGFIIPHLARRFVGPDFRYLVPASALLGAVCMVFIYYIATLVGYSENINFMTSIVGGSAFLIMIVRFRSKNNADWA